MLLYVMIEHPSVSQTFVVTEAAAVQNAGMPVVGYALRRGQATQSAAPLDLICPPPTKMALVRAVVRSYRDCVRTLWRARKHRISLGEAARLLLAQAHAEIAWPRAEEAGVTHVHAHFLGRTADVSQALAAKLCCKWTATSHGGDAYAPAEVALLDRRLQDIAGVACANARVERELVRRAGNTHLMTRVVHCGVNLESLRFQPNGTSRRVRRLITVGRLVATKGHWTILDAAAQLLTRDASLEWTIVGSGQLSEALQGDPRYRALYPRLQLAGPLDHSAALQALDGACAFVLPCEEDAQGGSDGIPVALMEAMAVGVPVVTTSIGGIGELVVDGTTGFIVPPRDAASVVRALEWILYTDPESKLPDIRRSARARIEEDFNSRREAQKLLEFISEVSAR